jgi:hypothetical protein
MAVLTGVRYGDVGVEPTGAQGALFPPPLFTTH